MRIYISIAFAIFLSTTQAQAIAQTGPIYSKCKTANGSTIIVEGTRCPNGTYYDGRA